MIKNLKRWKTIIQFIITVLTAIITTLTTASCLPRQHAQAPTNNHAHLLRQTWEHEAMPGTTISALYQPYL